MTFKQINLVNFQLVYRQLSSQERRLVISIFVYYDSV